MKKKIAWSIFAFLIFSLILWRDIPYLITTTDLISNQHIDFTYSYIGVHSFPNNSDSYFRTYNKEQIQNIIDSINNLKLRRITSDPSLNYSITFAGSYSTEEKISYVGFIFTLYIGEDNGNYILTIIPEELLQKHNYKAKSYKILNKDFDIEKFINQLKDEKI